MRPKNFNIKTLPEYNKLHTSKAKMYSGVELTILYPIKETDLYYISPEVWAYCASKFKKKKQGFTLEINIPELTDIKVIDFLKKHTYGRPPEGTDRIEAEEKLKKIFPEKKFSYFYELSSIISAFNNGIFIKYEMESHIVQPTTSQQIESQKYYTHKYNKFSDAPEVIAAREKWTSEKDKEKSSKYLDEYLSFESEWAFKNNNLTDVFIKIGEHTVCYPTGFSDSTTDWAIEKYGKLLGYAHAGEIYFINTKDEVFYEITRHF